MQVPHSSLRVAPGPEGIMNEKRRPPSSTPADLSWSSVGLDPVRVRTYCAC